jgi:hypothetical protein
MKQNVSRLVTCIVIMAATVFAQQAGPCEMRVNDLERRIRVLEQQLGISSLTSDASSSTYRASEVDSRQSAAVYSSSSLKSGSSTERSSAGRKELPLAVELVEKSLQEKGPGEESDRLGFEFEFRNIGLEHVTSFSGTIEIRDYDGSVLQSFPFDVATYVTAGDKTTWYASIPFSNTNAVHRKMHTSDISSLNIVLGLKQVMYYDTRVETFY